MSGTTSFGVREYGAVGDGRTKDTAAVQRTIDACAAAGGGTVQFAPGTYLCGSLELKSHVELHLVAGATLLASPHRADYVRRYDWDGVIRSNNVAGLGGAWNFDYHLINARKAEDVAITGQGAIDGNGRAFFSERNAFRTQMIRRTTDRGFRPMILGVRSWRPGPLLTFDRCRHIVLRDVRVLDAPAYSVWLVGCERAVIHAITVESNRCAPNTDGVDLVCSRDVRISDCSIATGDDAIGCFSMEMWLDAPFPCENVTVSNCTLSSPCCGVRIGFAPSDSPVRNCVFSNLVIRETRTGIDMLVPLESQPPVPPGVCRQPAEHGPTLENILFENLMIDADVALYLWVDSRVRPPAGIRNLSLANVRAVSRDACYIGGSAATPIDGLRISNLDLTVRGAVSGKLGLDPPEEVSMWRCPDIPHALYLRHARHVSLHGVRVEWPGVKGHWRSALRARDVRGLDVAGLVAGKALGGDHAAVHLTDVEDASLSGCRASPGGRLLETDGRTAAPVSGSADAAGTGRVRGG